MNIFKRIIIFLCIFCYNNSIAIDPYVQDLLDNQRSNAINNSPLDQSTIDNAKKNNYSIDNSDMISQNMKDKVDGDIATIENYTRTDTYKNNKESIETELFSSIASGRVCTSITNNSNTGLTETYDCAKTSTTEEVFYLDNTITTSLTTINNYNRDLLPNMRCYYGEIGRRGGARAGHCRKSVRTIDQTRDEVIFQIGNSMWWPHFTRIYKSYGCWRDGSPEICRRLYLIGGGYFYLNSSTFLQWLEKAEVNLYCSISFYCYRNNSLNNPNTTPTYPPQYWTSFTSNIYKNVTSHFLSNFKTSNYYGVRFIWPDIYDIDYYTFYLKLTLKHSQFKGTNSWGNATNLARYKQLLIEKGNNPAVKVDENCVSWYSTGSIYNLNGSIINLSDLGQSPIKNINNFCKKAKITITYGSGQSFNQCLNYERDNSCQLISSNCSITTNSGGCYVHENKYECSLLGGGGGNSEGEQVCLDSVNPDMLFETDVNSDYLKTITKGQAMQSIFTDSNCSDPNNVSTCRIFKGKTGHCDRLIMGIQNCCTRPSGIDLFEYIKSVAVMGSAIYSGATIENLQNVNGAWTSLHSGLGTGFQALSSPIESLTGWNVNNPFDTAKLLNTQEAYNIINNISPDLANSLFTGGGTSLSSSASTLGSFMSYYSAYVIALQVIKLLYPCTDTERDTVVDKERKTTRYVGEYCHHCLRVLGKCIACIERRQGYCRFNSPLSRIINEQARSQLGIGWGSASSPNCRGLTSDELNRVNFDAIDLTEWENLLKASGADEIVKKSIGPNKDQMENILKNTDSEVIMEKNRQEAEPYFNSLPKQ